jgi:glyoxylase-like metal-dependent hydrolase (beta-lactamase superfamily II)
MELVMMDHCRRQFAVGQGFFHAGKLSLNLKCHLRYVFDCGSEPLYAKELNSRIDAYVKDVGAKAPLDILFISHVHRDHVTGVERLLDPSSGLKVKTIVLPYQISMTG